LRRMFEADRPTERFWYEYILVVWLWCGFRSLGGRIRLAKFARGGKGACRELLRNCTARESSFAAETWIWSIEKCSLHWSCYPWLQHLCVLMACSGE
jgi:IS1 family transposase